jgi:hypothetical protein
VLVLAFAQMEQNVQLWLHITKSVTVSLNFAKQAIHQVKFSQHLTEVDLYASQKIAVTQYMGPFMI